MRKPRRNPEKIQNNQSSYYEIYPKCFIYKSSQGIRYNNRNKETKKFYINEVDWYFCK